MWESTILGSGTERFASDLSVHVLVALFFFDLPRSLLHGTSCACKIN